MVLVDSKFLSALDDRTEAEQKFVDQRCNLLCLHVYKTINVINFFFPS